MVDGCVLLLSQHYQGDDNDSRYDDTSYHQANNSTLVRADVFGEENLTSRREWRKEKCSKGRTITLSKDFVTRENAQVKIQQLPSQWVCVAMPT